MKARGPSLPIDRRFARVLGPGQKARIQVASGTHDPKLLAELNSMLDAFALRQPDLLKEIRDCRVTKLTPLRAYHELWLTGKWARYTGRTHHARPLVETLEKWAKRKVRKGLSESTREARMRFASVVKDYARAGALLSELPRMLERYRADYDDDDRASTFNHARNYARAFLRDTVKPSDALYLAVVDLRPLQETPKRGRHPQTPEGARAIAQQLGAKAGPIWLSLCYCGMTLKEYFQDGWEVDYPLGAVRIHGRKRAKRERLVPLLAAPVVPSLTRAGFVSALKRLGLVTAHDARRSYANWLAAVGIAANRKDYYRGHKPEQMAGLYEQPGDALPMIREWIAEDTPKLQTYCGLPKAGLNVESA